VPIDGVKIDRSFVADILRDLTTRAYHRIIAMAHSLGIIVIAEASSAKDSTRLRERDCDLAQGYLLGHPLTLADSWRAALTHLAAGRRGSERPGGINSAGAATPPRCQIA
jgi:EAL domain-containing protein (putative c-di-GMP-specific phosphodiesterase class I)